MTAAALLAGLDDTTLVEFSMFVLQEIPMSRVALEVGVPPDGTRAVGGPGGIVFLSRLSDHYPRVRIELWSGKPEPATGRWDASEELTADLSGAVRLQSVTMAVSDHRLSLPRSGPYGVAVHVRDDPRGADIEEGSFARTAERWLVRLWPRQ